MTKLDKEQVIAAFTEAYTAANGKAPEIEAKGGWYSVDGGKNIRLAQLQEMTDALQGGNDDAEVEEVKASEPEAKPATKKETKKAKPTKAKQATGTFSVKAFWNEQVLSQKPGSRAPR